MDERTIDRWAMSLAQRPTRRAALRWVASSVLGGVMSSRWVAAARAQDACGGCPPGHICSAGSVCLVPAPPDVLDECLVQGLRECGGICVDVKKDSSNCGACGIVCGGPVSCCGGICVDLDSDAANCGACGRTCGFGRRCVEGSCISLSQLCSSLGLTLCDGVCVDTATDSDFCGGCQFACYGGTHCVDGSCIH